MDFLQNYVSFLLLFCLLLFYIDIKLGSIVIILLNVLTQMGTVFKKYITSTVSISARNVNML